MNYPEDHIACEQARVLGGLEHRHPEHNYSFEIFNETPLMDLAHGLSGPSEMGNFVFRQGPGEPDPLLSIRVRLNNVVRRF